MKVDGRAVRVVKWTVMDGERRLGLGSATALVVANMVGTGVFTTSGFLIADLGSAWLVLLAWVLGGLVALDAKVSLRATSTLAALLGLLSRIPEWDRDGPAWRCYPCVGQTHVRRVHRGGSCRRTRRASASRTGADRGAGRRQLDRRQRSSHAGMGHAQELNPIVSAT